MHYLEFPQLQPLRPFILDPKISEIMINGLSRFFVERSGKMIELEPVYNVQAKLDAAVEALVGLSGRAVNMRTPFVDFRLPDGSRVNVVVRPIALEGPVITIRRASRDLQDIEDIVARGTLTDQMSEFLQACVKARINIVFSGGTGSGKTTLLGLLGVTIPDHERIVVIEDTAELVFRQSNVVRMECRPPTVEGTAAITLSDLLKNSLRMRPTRIVLGEVRGDEAFDLLSAMSSGHEGGFAVLHASSPEQAVARLALMVLGRGLSYPLWAIQQQIASAIDLIVQHVQLADGARRVSHIAAVQGAGEGQVILEDLYRFEQLGADPDGRISGRFVTTGVIPHWFPKLRRACGPSVDSLLQPMSTRPIVGTAPPPAQSAPPPDARRSERPEARRR